MQSLPAHCSPEFILFISTLCHSDVKWTRWAVKTRLLGRTSHRRTTATCQKHRSSPFSLSSFFPIVEIQIEQIFSHSLDSDVWVTEWATSMTVGSVSFVVRWWFLCVRGKFLLQFVYGPFKRQTVISHFPVCYWKLGVVMRMQSWTPSNLCTIVELNYSFSNLTFNYVYCVYNQCFCALIMDAGTGRGAQGVRGPWRPQIRCFLGLMAFVY